MMADLPARLEALPNEIFEHVLHPLTTRELLVASSVNHLFHSVVTRMLHRRLSSVSSLPNNDLILECYHPSAKITTPYLTCRHINSKVTKSKASEPASPHIRSMYSSFCPLVDEDDILAPRLRQRRSSLRGHLGLEADSSISMDVHLDEGELFSQLCAVTNVVKQGPRRGLFVGHANVSDGVVRVWREWLAQRASRQDDASAVDEEWFDADDDGILWVDTAKSVGLRFRVVLGPAERMPLISGPGDEGPVSYTLVYEEVLVQTYRLLLKVDEIANQEIAHSGRVTTFDGLRGLPFKLFAPNPRTTWLTPDSPAIDHVLGSQKS